MYLGLGVVGMVLPPQDTSICGSLFRQHVSTICQKAYTATNVLFRCFNTDNAKSFVRPLLEYCSTVWNPFIHAKYYLGMTDELENTVVFIIAADLIAIMIIWQGLITYN